VSGGLNITNIATASGTDLGGFMGMPPTGRAVKVPIVFLYEFRDGLPKDTRPPNASEMLASQRFLR